MPTTLTIQALRFSELSDRAKKHASQSLIEPYNHTSEAIASLEAFADAFDASISYADIDFSGAHPAVIDFDCNAMDVSELSKRLANLGGYNSTTLRGLGDCKLTGASTDEDVLDGFRIAFMRDKETDLKSLLLAGARELVMSCARDYQHQTSEDYLSERCDANGFLFLENGTRIS